MPSHHQSLVSRVPIKVLSFLVGLSFFLPLGRLNLISFWLTGFIGVLLLTGAWLLNKKAHQSPTNWASLFAIAYVGFWRGLAISLFIAVWFGIAWQSGYRR